MEFIKSIFVYIFRGGIILSFILLCLNEENKNIIIDDYDNNSKVIGQRKFNVMNLQKLLLYKRTFRNVIFHRLSEFHVSKVLKILFKFFYSLSPAVYVFGKFGGGLRLNHDYMVIRVEKAGRDFVVQQGVTIAGLKDGKYPRFGDDVYIGANAMVLGDVNCGSHVNIGAGAFVLNMDIPDWSTVVGNPAHIIDRSK